jgi:sphingomyelin phosphodiesterase acid-like 3
MNTERTQFAFRRIPFHMAAIGFFLLFQWSLAAQDPAAGAPKPAQARTGSALKSTSDVSALLVSDIHFEPFWDPGKVQQLATEPVRQWDAVLSAPPSPDQAARFAALQETCHARGADTSYSLLRSSLHAMQEHARNAKFVTVSGDLIAHAFSCKFGAVFPQAKPGDYRAFVLKTLDYVAGELRNSIPGVPVYVALGNNDSDCGDYRLDPQSDFLTGEGRSVTGHFPAAKQNEALKTYAEGGYYSVSLPAPIRRARLIVLEDVFMSRKYETCGGKPDASAADEEIAWLRQQLAHARQENEAVWVMGHIPPGVDPFSTVAKRRDVCGGQKPEMFLSSATLPETLAEYGDVVRLGIFAHTHMDEMRFLKSEVDGTSAAAQQGVPIKLVPSISPIDGNNPSFTVASIDPSTAILKDYRIFAASDSSGIGASWEEEYDYAQSFHQASFSGRDVAQLMAGFETDRSGSTEPSQSYMRSYFVRDVSLEIKSFWPQYVCAFTHWTAESFRACTCSNAR